MKLARRIMLNWLPAYALLYVLFLYLPVLLLPLFSVNSSPIPKLPIAGFTFKWYESLPRTPALLDAAHWATERPWLDLLAGQLADVLPIGTVISDLVTDPWTVHVPAGRAPQ